MLLDQENKLKEIETLGKVGLDIKRAMEEEIALMIKETTTRPPSSLSDISKAGILPSIMVQLSHLMISTGVNEGQNYTQLAVAIGERIRNYYKLNRKSNKALQLGAFVLNAYTINELIIVKLVNDYRFNKAKTVYKVYAGNKGKLRQLRKEFDEVSDPYKPLLKPAPNWEAGTVKIENGEEIKLIKDSSVDVYTQINSINTPIVLKAVNKKQEIAFTVDPKVFEVYKWALKTGQNCFEHNSVDTIEIDRKLAKKREATQVMESAVPYIGKTFYQQYQADNRGRLYPLSAYLNELNSDNAKGMIKFAIGAPLGETGKEELFHHIANMFGEDKLPHKDRVAFVQERYAYFSDMGRDPYEYKGWMNAEEPFQFLQAVMELHKLYCWEMSDQSANKFVSHTICYRDGSNNGLQWLFSLAKDEQNAHLANVKPTTNNKPGDMYQHVANAVIQKIGETAIDDAVALENYELYFKTIETLRNRCRKVELDLGKKDPVSERKRKVIKWYQRRYKEQLKTTDLLYWNKAKFDPKTWRKIVKRNVMTYGYSATKQGMGEQIIQDTRDIDNKYLSNKQHSAARLLGGLVYSTIEQQFPMVSNTMKLFKNNCGKYMKDTGKQYSHKTVISNFPFTQRYVKYKKGRVWVDKVLVQKEDRTNEYKTIEFTIHLELSEPNIQKAKAGISPNTIHNLDSLHLMLVIEACNFDIVSAHDSYGTRACNIQVMNKVIREQFKRVIDESPIQSILDQTGNLFPMLETGTLDSSEILNSEFAFA